MSTRKQKQKTTTKCSKCLHFEEMPIWGHPLCPYHRNCSGQDKWEPTNCTYCKKQKLALAKLTAEDQEVSLQSMLNMLEQTENYKNDIIGVEWAYEETIQNWLPKYKVNLKSAEQELVETHSNRGNENTDDSNNDGANVQNTSAADITVHQSDEHPDNSHNEQVNDTEHENNHRNVSREQSYRYSDNQDRERHSRRYHSYCDEHICPHTSNNRPSRREMFERERIYQDRSTQPIQYPERNDDSNRLKRHRSPSFPQDENSQYFQPSYEDYYDEYNQNRGDLEHDHIPYYNDYAYGNTSPNVNQHPVLPYEVDYSTGITWINFDSRIHTRKDSNKIEIQSPQGPHTVNVTYKIGNTMQFQTIATTKKEDRSPYIDPREGHAVILSAFDRSLSNNDMGSNRYIGIESSLVAGSGLAETFDLLKRHETTMTQTAVEKGFSELLETFPKTAFDAVSIIDFTSGWNFSNTSTFAAFAKDKEIDVKAFLNRIDSDVTKMDTRVNKFLLKKEKETRKAMIQLSTPLHLLDLMGEKIDKLEESVKNKSNISSSQTNSIARTISPVLKHTVCTWMIAKMSVRNAVLKNRDNPKVMKLLKSSLWEAGLFAEEAIKEVESSITNNLPVMLGLSTYNYHRDNKPYIPPYKRIRMAPPRHIQTQQNNYRHPNRHQGFRNPQPRKPQPQPQPSTPKTNQRNWQSHYPAKDNETQDFKNQQNQRRNPNNYNKNRNTEYNRRGNQRK